MSVCRVIVYALVFIVCRLAASMANDDPMGTIYHLRKKCKMAEEYSKSNKHQLDGADLVSVGMCIGFIRGVGSVLVMNCEQRRNGKLVEYAAENASLDAYVQAFLDWSDAHPEDWSEQKSLVIVPLMQTFPCKP